MRKTALHQSHIALGAKMGEFAGYDMPLYYKDGVLKEHEWVREKAGIFDVSHMGQITVEGPGAAAFLERLTPSAFQGRKPGKAQYTVLTNEAGGIIDDLIITPYAQDKFFIVLNAGRKAVDMKWIADHMPESLSFTYLADRGLIAVQGPRAEAVINETLGVNLSSLSYMHMLLDRPHVGDSGEIMISRLGYTGEDGFELSVQHDKTEKIWDLLRAHPDVRPIGLAARDSLRLEMGYCLYGHDITEETSPVAAGLEWVMSKNNTSFIGADKVIGQTPARRRVGIQLLEPGVAREGAEILDSTGQKIGVLTSGGPSPSLKKSIGQGYIESSKAVAGQKVFVNVRGRNIAAEVAKMPFMPPKTKAARK